MGRAADAMPGIELVDIGDPALHRREVADQLLQRRGHKGMHARTRRAGRRHIAAARRRRDGSARRADGCVAGAVHTTGRRGARGHLAWWGPRAGVRTVSSAFYMEVPPFRGDEAEVLTFTDCAVVPVPHRGAAGGHRHRRGGGPASHRGRRAARRLPVVQHARQRRGRKRRAGAGRARRWCGEWRPSSPWTENCKGTLRSSRRWRSGRRRTVPSAGRRTCWSSRTSMRETSPTSWCSGWPRRRRSARSFRGCGVRATISRAERRAEDIFNVAAITALQADDARPRYRTGSARRQAHELLDQEAG